MNLTILSTHGQIVPPYTNIDPELIGVSVGDRFEYHFEYVDNRSIWLVDPENDLYPKDFESSIEVVGINLTSGEYSLLYFHYSGLNSTGTFSFRLFDRSDRIVALDWDEWFKSDKFKNNTKIDEDTYSNRTIISRTYNRADEFERTVEYKYINDKADEEYNQRRFDLDLKQSIWNKSTGVLKYTKYNLTRVYQNGSIVVDISFATYLKYEYYAPDIPTSSETDQSKTTTKLLIPWYITPVLLIVISSKYTSRKSKVQ